MPNQSSPAEAASEQKPKNRTFLVLGAVALVVVALLFMEAIPKALRWPLRLLFLGSLIYLAIAIFQNLRRAKFEAKKLVFSLILVGIVYGALYLVCSVFVKLMATRDASMAAARTTELTEKTRNRIKRIVAGETPAMYDPDIGWVHRPGYSWNIHSISEQGLRGTRTYPETPPDPEKRLLCVGDSFTFGYEVEDDQTYPHHAEQLLPGTEWLNLGVTGTGLTQALLRYRKTGKKFGGKYVVFGFMTHNGRRSVNCFRPFVSPEDYTPLAQPFAKLTEGELTIEPNPYQKASDYDQLFADERAELKRLTQLDYLTWSKQHGSTNPVVRTVRYIWERREVGRNLAILLNRSPDTGALRPGDDPYGGSIWHPDSLGFQTITALFDLCHEEVTADGRVPLFVILPSATDVKTQLKGRPARHAALVEHLEQRGYQHFDFLDSLVEFHGDALSPELLYNRSHFNGESNKLLAEEIIKALSLR